MNLADAMKEAIAVLKTRSNPKKSTRLDYLDMDEHPTSIQAVFLGKGMFTKAYLGDDNSVYLVTITDNGVSNVDWSKEMLSELYRDDGQQPHIPIVEKMGWKDIRFKGSMVEGTVYRSPLYNAPLRKGNSEIAWKEYRAVEKAWRSARRSVPQNIYNGHRINSDTIENYGKDDSVREALEELSGGIANYGSEYTFEFSPRNLATDGNGQLIFLDVMFSLRAVRGI
jgi:hypothetical protein